MANTENNNFTIIGLFKDDASAECAYSALSGRGYEKDSTDVLMSDQTRDKYYSGADADDTELGSKAAEGTGVGAAVGGTLGAIVAAIAAIGTSFVLPGLGLVVAGPLAASFIGAGAGGITGGLIGALVGSGIPEEHAEVYEEGIKSGGIVLRAYPRNAEDLAFIEDKWEDCGGEQIFTYEGEEMSQVNTANTRRVDADGVAIPVIEEELHVGKRAVESGGVKVRTDVKEIPVEETVKLREENVVVERTPVNRPVSDADIEAVKDGDLTITERAEKAVVGKDARVVEEVVVGKKVDERTETVSDTVRRTEVDVEELDADERTNRNR